MNLNQLELESKLFIKPLYDLNTCLNEWLFSIDEDKLFCISSNITDIINTITRVNYTLNRLNSIDFSYKTENTYNYYLSGLSEDINNRMMGVFRIKTVAYSDVVIIIKASIVSDRVVIYVLNVYGGDLAGVKEYGIKAKEINSENLKPIFHQLEIILLNSISDIFPK